MRGKYLRKLQNGLLFILFLLLNVRGVYAADAPVIVLDPGHDMAHGRGKNLATGIVEEDYTLDIAKACKETLEEAGFTVYLTREDGSCPAKKGTGLTDCLQERAVFAASVGCDLFVSIHLNAAGNNDGIPKAARGSLVFISNYGAYTEPLTRLADMISDGLRTECGIMKRGTTGTITLSESFPGYDDGSRSNFLGVIRNSVYNGFPAILIEEAFMDNRSDALLLSDRERIGRTNAESIIAFYDKGLGIKAVSGPATNNFASGIVDYSFLNLRNAPESEAELVCELSEKDQVYIYEDSGTYKHVIALHDGAYYEGYVSGEYLKLDSEVKRPGKLSKEHEVKLIRKDQGLKEKFKSFGFVNHAWLNLRKEATTASDILAVLSEKDPIRILSKDRDWYEVLVLHEGQTLKGFVKSSYVGLYKDIAHVNYEFLNVRSGPDTSFDKIDKLTEKKAVAIFESLDGWCHVIYVDQDHKVKTGFVSSEYLTMEN